MAADPPAGPFRVVLWGAGHTHTLALARARRAPIPGADLTLVNDFPTTSYSGLLTGVLAGDESEAAMTVDLPRLCRSAGTRLVVARGVGLDLGARRLLLGGGGSVPYDALSVGVGSAPARDGVAGWGAGPLVALKPWQTFTARLADRLRTAGAFRCGAPLRLAVVGGGAGGAEIALCLPPAVRRAAGPGLTVVLTLIGDAPALPDGLGAWASALVRRELVARGVRLMPGRRVVGLDAGGLTLAGGETLAADAVVWAAGAAGAPALRGLGLATDGRGSLLTRPSLQTLDDGRVFAVGDAGASADSSTPKAGLYAVRQAPVLWRNLRRLRDGRPLEPFRPQRDALRLLNLGDGRAVADFHGLAFRGRWCRAWKSWIDRRHVRHLGHGRPEAGP